MLPHSLLALFILTGSYVGESTISSAAVSGSGGEPCNSTPSASDFSPGEFVEQQFQSLHEWENNRSLLQFIANAMARKCHP